MQMADQVDMETNTSVDYAVHISKLPRDLMFAHSLASCIPLFLSLSSCFVHDLTIYKFTQDCIAGGGDSNSHRDPQIIYNHFSKWGPIVQVCLSVDAGDLEDEIEEREKAFESVGIFYHLFRASRHSTGTGCVHLIPESGHSRTSFTQ